MRAELPVIYKIFLMRILDKMAKRQQKEPQLTMKDIGMYMGVHFHIPMELRFEVLNELQEKYGAITIEKGMVRILWMPVRNGNRGVVRGKL